MFIFIPVFTACTLYTFCLVFLCLALSCSGACDGRVRRGRARAALGARGRTVARAPRAQHCAGADQTTRPFIVSPTFFLKICFTRIFLQIFSSVFFSADFSPDFSKSRLSSTPRFPAFPPFTQSCSLSCDPRSLPNHMKSRRHVRCAGLLRRGRAPSASRARGRARHIDRRTRTLARYVAPYLGLGV